MTLDEDRVDPAALLLAVLATSAQFTIESGAWGPLNTVIGVIIGLITLCFTWPSKRPLARYRVGYYLALAFVAAITISWPIEAWWFPGGATVEEVAHNANKATYASLGICILLVTGVGEWRLRRYPPA